MTVWRLKTKPQGLDPDLRTKLIQAMLNEAFLASGWHVTHAPKTPEEYCQMAIQEHGEQPTRNIRRFVVETQPGDLVWIIDTSGLFHLAEVAGAWQYRRDSRTFGLHAVNRFPCHWVARNLTAADTPSGVRNALMQGGVFARINDQAATRYSEDIAGKAQAPFNGSFLELIGHDALEDLVGLYLQVHLNAVLIPGSCKQSTASYEFVLKRKDGGGDVVAQVKSGRAKISDNLSTVQADRYLFAVCGEYPNDLEGAHIVAPEDLREFARQNAGLLPNTISRWLQLDPPP